MIRTKYTEVDFSTACDGTCPGPDFEWFGIDSEGHVAAFTNAGHGPVPATVFSSWELFNRTLDTISALPQIGDAEWIVSKPPRFDTWQDWASRGLFAFDWQHAPSLPAPTLPYDLFAIPSRPLLVSQLPDDVADFISGTTFPSLQFARLTHLLP